MVIPFRNLVLFPLMVLCGLVFLIGCSGSTDTTFGDGRLYAVNNTRPPTIPGGSDFVKRMWVIYDGIRFDPPNNLTTDGESTGAGCMELTEEPLPGGTTVTVEYKFDHMNAFVEAREITVIIDGNTTIDIYMENWSITGYGSTVIARVVPGKWGGTTIVHGGG